MSRRSSRVRKEIQRFGAENSDEEELPRPPRKRRRNAGSLGLNRELRQDEINREKSLIRRTILYEASKGELVKDSDLNKFLTRTQDQAQRKRTMELSRDQLGKMLGLEFTRIKKGAFVVYAPEQNQLEDEPQNLWYRSQASMRYLILSFVLLSGNVIEDKILWDYLGRLGLEPKSAPTFIGNIKQFLESMVRQGFLKKEKN